jgi:hypothetical protein
MQRSGVDREPDQHKAEETRRKKGNSMNVRKSILTAAAALLIVAGGAASTVDAAETSSGNASVKIATSGSNVLSVEIASADFGTSDYSYVEMSKNAKVTVTATDNRGTGLGWHVNLSGTNFNGDNGKSIAISNLSLTADALQGIAINGYNPSTDGISKSNASPVTTSQTPILSAQPMKGMGQYKLEMNGALKIPAGTLVGTYTSVLTVQIASAP